MPLKNSKLCLMTEPTIVFVCVHQNLAYYSTAGRNKNGKE